MKNSEELNNEARQIIERISDDYNTNIDKRYLECMAVKFFLQDGMSVDEIARMMMSIDYIGKPVQDEKKLMRRYKARVMKNMMYLGVCYEES